jgi:hypothetical protein
MKIADEGVFAISVPNKNFVEIFWYVLLPFLHILVYSCIRSLCAAKEKLPGLGGSQLKGKRREIQCQKK